MIEVPTHPERACNPTRRAPCQGSRPCAGCLALLERQLDYHRAGALLPNGDGCARLCLATYERQSDWAEPGGEDGAAQAPNRPLAKRQHRARLGRLRQAQASQATVRFALVEEPRHRLLTYVATLGEAHCALIQARLLGDRALVEVDPVARSATLDAHDLGCRLARLDGAGGQQSVAHGLERVGVE